MPLIAPSLPTGPHLKRGGAAALLTVGVAGALSIATLSNPTLSHAVGQGLSKGLHGVETVAAMLAERSPGQRPEGALAQLKHKRAAALHERALPKVRGPAPTAYEALAGPPPTLPIVTPPPGPLYTAVAGGPTSIIPPTGGASGGPPVLSDIPPPGGGGGGFTPTPITTQEVPPVVTPATPVPEPGTWAMMILGFALLGRALTRKIPARAAATLQ
jgi:hypothetical protein